MCTNRTSPRMSKIRMLPSQPTLVFVGITGLEPAPLFLTPVPKTGRIPITDYIPKYCAAEGNRTPRAKMTTLLQSAPLPITAFLKSNSMLTT